MLIALISRLHVICGEASQKRLAKLGRIFKLPHARMSGAVEIDIDQIQQDMFINRVQSGTFVGQGTHAPDVSWLSPKN